MTVEENNFLLADMILRLAASKREQVSDSPLGDEKGSNVGSNERDYNKKVDFHCFGFLSIL
jgi:hypothetical protein